MSAPKPDGATVRGEAPLTGLSTVSPGRSRELNAPAFDGTFAAAGVAAEELPTRNKRLSIATAILTRAS